MLPLFFIADAFYWLYTFGHHLDPHAPLHVGAFTPHLVGTGMIGQFETWAQPQIGFWAAIIGVLLVIASAVVRRNHRR